MRPANHSYLAVALVIAVSLTWIGPVQTLAAVQGGMVRGRVIVEGGGPMPQKVEFTYRLGGCVACVSQTASADVRPDGAFAMRLEDGRRIVWEQWGAAPEGLVPKAAACIVAGQRPNVDPALATGSNDLFNHRAALCTNTEMRLTFETVGSKVSGRAVGARAGRTIQLSGLTSVSGTHPTVISLEAAIGEGGTFSFSGVVRGRYEISLKDSVDRPTVILMTNADVSGIEVLSPR